MAAKRQRCTLSEPKRQWWPTAGRASLILTYLTYMLSVPDLAGTQHQVEGFWRWSRLGKAQQLRQIQLRADRFEHHKPHSESGLLLARSSGVARHESKPRSIAGCEEVQRANDPVLHRKEMVGRVEKACVCSL